MAQSSRVSQDDKIEGCALTMLARPEVIRTWRITWRRDRDHHLGMLNNNIYIYITECQTRLNTTRTIPPSGPLVRAVGARLCEFLIEAYSRNNPISADVPVRI